MESTHDQASDLQRQLAELQQSLLHAQKLSALGELVSTTTHEFNNVLTTIINYAKMGLRHRDEATRTKAFEKILAAGERAARITHSVLGMARNRSSAFEPTSWAEIIRETLVLLEREFAKYRIRVELHLPDVPPVLAVGNQIQQVLLNLLINARQAMPDGGQVTIRLEHDTVNQTVDLIVRDTGTGIPPDQLRRIFVPFFSTKQGPDATGKGGTGLGLACCRNVVEAHRGRIRVESTVGRGTSFTIKLPVFQPPTNAAETARAPENESEAFPVSSSESANITPQM
jgi:signal transduction histidine kinase